MPAAAGLGKAPAEGSQTEEVERFVEDLRKYAELISGNMTVHPDLMCLIQDNDFVYIDAGTTTLAMIDYIDNYKAKYITNGIVHAKKLIDKGLETIMIGGRLKKATEAVVGPASM